MMGYCDVKIATKQLFCRVSANSDAMAGRVAPEMGGAERRSVKSRGVADYPGVTWLLRSWGTCTWILPGEPDEDEIPLAELMRGVQP